MINLAKGFALGIVVTVAVLGWFCYTHLIVRTADGIVTVPKLESGLERLYVDIREWTALDYMQRRDVTGALAAAGISRAQNKLQAAFEKAKEHASKAEKSLDLKAKDQ